MNRAAGGLHPSAHHGSGVSPRCRATSRAVQRSPPAEQDAGPPGVQPAAWCVSLRGKPAEHPLAKRLGGNPSRRMLLRNRRRRDDFAGQSPACPGAGEACGAVLAYIFCVSPSIFVTLENPTRVASGMSVLDWSEGLYWSIITSTTVGYGDIVPQTPYARLLVLFNASLGVTLMGVIARLILSLVTPRRID